MKATFTCLCKIHSRLYNMYIRPYLKRSILPQDCIQNQWCSYRYILPNVPCLHSWYYSKRCFPSLKSPSFNFRYGTHLKILIEQPHFVSKLWTLPFSSRLLICIYSKQSQLHSCMGSQLISHSYSICLKRATNKFIYIFLDLSKSINTGLHSSFTFRVFPDQWEFAK